MLHPSPLTTVLAFVFPMRRRDSIGRVTVPMIQSIPLGDFKMSVRVVARIRPLLKTEHAVDTIVRTSGADEKARPNVVKVPNPKNFSEEFSFQFNSVYDEDATQQEIFDAEGNRPPATGGVNVIDTEP